MRSSFLFAAWGSGSITSDLSLGLSWRRRAASGRPAAGGSECVPAEGASWIACGCFIYCQTALDNNASVKHAGPPALDRLDSVLRQVRKLDSLRERRRGSLDSRFGVTLHFHEDPTGLYADLRSAGKTKRHRVTTIGERAAILGLLKAALRSHRKPFREIPGP